MANKKKETEEDFMKEEQEAPEKKSRRNLSKTFLLMETDVNVPELEPEDAVIHPPKNPGQSVFSNMEEMNRSRLQKRKSRAVRKNRLPEKIRRYWNQRILGSS